MSNDSGFTPGDDGSDDFESKAADFSDADSAGENREHQNQSSLRARIDSALERSSGIDATEQADEREKLVIIRAMAVGFSVFRWVCLGVALVFIASGMWFAAFLVMAVTDLPRWAAMFYARNRGVDFLQQSGIRRYNTTVRSIVVGLICIALVIGFVIYHSVTGHPLIDWSWRTPNFDGELTSSIAIGLGVGAVVALLLWIRRRRHFHRFGKYSRN